MQNRSLPARMIVWLALSVHLATAGAADLRISIPPPPDKTDSRPYWVTALANAIAKEWKDGKVTILRAGSFEQSVANVVSGKADLHFPLMASPARDDEELPYRYSRFTLHETPFNFYVRKDNQAAFSGPLTITALEKMNIETEQAHTGLFFFALKGVADIETGLRHVSAGKTDGFLYAGAATDATLKQLKLANVVRVPYRRFQSKMVFAKSTGSQDVEEKIGLIIDRLKDSGEYQKIMAHSAQASPVR